MKNTIELRLKHRIYAMVLPFLWSITLMGQQRTITGVVSDDFGEALPGVTILIKGTTQGTVSAIDGSYSINAPGTADDILIFSFVGMVTQEVAVSDRSTINVTLESDITNLEEVIVVGYGTQRAKDVTGAVSLVGADDMEQRPNTQIGSLILGKATGVQLAPSSGKPGQGLSLRIRGINSIGSSSEPLYVVDGVPTSDTRAINPADIESISILKDAASAAIYGAQGGNGVVLITTKSGGKSGPSLNFNAYVGFSEVWRQLDVLDGEGYQDLMTELGQNTNWDLYYHNTDWQDEIFQQGTSQNYQASISGGTDKTSYYISGGWTEQEGAVRSTRMDRSNFKINLDQELFNWLTVGTRVLYTNYADVDVDDRSIANRGGVLLGALFTPSIIDKFNKDGSFTSNPFQNWENPLAGTDGLVRGYERQRMLANVYAEFKVFEKFKFKSNLGIDHANGLYEEFLDPFRTSYGRAINGRAVSNVDKSRYRIFDNTLSYENVLGKSTFSALVGSIYQSYLWEDNRVATENFSGDGIQTANAGSRLMEASAYKSEKTNISYISRFNYDYDSRYLLTVNFRADGSSVFGPDNRWGYFPSVSLGWRLSEEAFLQGVDFLTDLKLRAGWGIVGNDQVDPYKYLGRVNSGANYVIGGAIQPGIYPSTIQNNNLKWEESKQTNIGVDIEVLKGRVGFNVDLYHKETSDLLLDAPLPRSSGFDRSVQNIGSLENRGLELALNTINFDGELSWTTNLNVSFNRNEVTNLVGQEILDGSFPNRGEASIVREGEPLGTLYGYVYDGVDTATGEALYSGVDGESTASPNPEDRVIIGDANPDFIYGFTNTLSYKGFGLTVFFQGSHGNDMLNATRMDAVGMRDPKNQSVEVLDRWRQPGDVTDVPASSWGSIDNSRISTRFIEDASYLRLKTLTISYSFPTTWLSKIQVKGLMLYVTGENLLTFTDYSGYDPEVNANGGSNTSLGIDFGTYPQTRNIITGLNLTF